MIHTADLLPDHPRNWNEEIKTDGRRATHTPTFLLWLRMKFEEIRQFNNLQKNKAKKETICNKELGGDSPNIIHAGEYV